MILTQLEEKCAILSVPRTRNLLSPFASAE